MERHPRRRRRQALSCFECRRRKIKCDRNDPCGHCVSAKSQCVFSNEPVIQQQPQQGGGSLGSASSSSVYRPLPLAQAQQIGNNNTSVTERDSHPPGSWAATTAAAPPSPPPPPPPPAGGQNDTQNSLGRNDIRPLNYTQDAAPDLRHLLRRIQQLEQQLEESSAASPVHNLPGPDRVVLTRQPGLQDEELFLKKDRTFGRNHWMGKAEQFAVIIDCYSEVTGHGKGASFQGAETRALVVQIGDLLRKCKTLARSMKVGRPSRCLSSPEFGLAPPSREVADAMAALYFRSFESTHRILHVPTFWTDYQRYWNDQESVATGLRLKILLVIAIGSSLDEHGGTDTGFRNMVLQWVYTAQTWLSGPLEKDRLDMTGLQVHCLAILARQIFCIGGDLVWISMGSLINAAMQMGLHRDPKHLPPMRVLQAELRRRLWATILEMAVQSSLDSCMSPRISLDEFDTEAPSNRDDAEMDEESTAALQPPPPKDTYTATSMQLILLETLPTRLRIVQLLNGLRSEPSYPDVLALSSELTGACRASSKFMKEHEPSGDVTPFHRNLLDYLLRRFLIPLHLPFASEARTNPLFYYSLKAGLDAAMAIISPEPDEAFSRLMVIGGGLFREGFRLAFTVVSLELVGQTEAQRLDGTLRRSSRHVEMLKQAMRDMAALSLQRIRRGETNVKSHMFLCMILAQVEAAEAGAPSCELAVAQAARDSLELCHGLIQTRAGAVSSLPGLSDTGYSPARLDGGSRDGSYGLDLDLDFFMPDGAFS